MILSSVFNQCKTGGYCLAFHKQRVIWLIFIIIDTGEISQTNMKFKKFPDEKRRFER